MKVHRTRGATSFRFVYYICFENVLLQRFQQYPVYDDNWLQIYRKRKARAIMQVNQYDNFYQQNYGMFEDSQQRFLPSSINTNSGQWSQLPGQHLHHHHHHLNATNNSHNNIAPNPHNGHHHTATNTTNHQHHQGHQPPPPQHRLMYPQQTSAVTTTSSHDKLNHQTRSPYQISSMQVRGVDNTGYL